MGYLGFDVAAVNLAGMTSYTPGTSLYRKLD